MYLSLVGYLLCTHLGSRRAALSLPPPLFGEECLNSWICWAWFASLVWDPKPYHRIEYRIVDKYDMISKSMLCPNFCFPAGQDRSLISNLPILAPVLICPPPLFSLYASSSSQARSYHCRPGRRPSRKAAASGACRGPADPACAATTTATTTRRPRPSRPASTAAPRPASASRTRRPRTSCSSGPGCGTGCGSGGSAGTRTRPGRRGLAPVGAARRRRRPSAVDVLGLLAPRLSGLLLFPGPVVWTLARPWSVCVWAARSLWW